MDSTEDRKGAPAPPGGAASAPPNGGTAAQPGEPVPPEPAAESSDGGEGPHASTVETPTDYYQDTYPTEDSTRALTPEPAPVKPVPAAGGGGSKGAPPATSSDDDSDDEGMLRMSFLEHLEELRSRIFKMLLGIGVAFALSLTFSNQLWRFVSAPARAALTQLGIDPPDLVQITPMEVFNVIYVKLPILSAIFLASPWVLYQVWGFIAPGLYKKERRWAAPFVICSAGLFIMGGLFAYFVAFRFGLTFLLGLGRGQYIAPMVSVTEYFDLFVNVMMGVALVFELPVLIFFLTLLHIVTPRFLISNSRYAILIIVALAAIVTPTPDIFNLMMFATPMVLLFYVGIFASYLLVLQREQRRFPWRRVLYVALVILAALAGAAYLAIAKYGYHWAGRWPFFTR